ncbi:hypothetical protein DFH09DRAFT_1319694 [Mycena vulgaris]|nr:hypothetical protein DFH09DRAFT_1338848 [Mycena vulgaris]KAJ6550828.1 hypothetical protein DFH09DRAFT_1319694 [Mycena vulgaris]
MFPKTSLLAASLFIMSAWAQCPNGGVGVGLSQLAVCTITTKGPGSRKSYLSGYCGVPGFITTPGTLDEAAIKNNLRVSKDLCGDGYTHGAYTTCDGDGNVISVNPPDAGRANYKQQSEIVGVSTGLGPLAIYYCCYN